MHTRTNTNYLGNHWLPSVGLDNKKLNNKNQSLNKKNEKLKAQLKKSNDKNKEILNSTSWKITKPIRMPKLLIKKMKK